MEPCHIENESLTTANPDGVINNKNNDTNKIVNMEPNNNEVGKDKSNVVLAKQMYFNNCVDNEQAQIESVKDNISEMEGCVHSDEDFCVCDELLLNNVKLPLSKCIDIISTAEKLIKDRFTDFQLEACKSNDENLVPVINEQHIMINLTDFMKTLCSDCENGDSLCKKCQGESLLQCLKCNEKFYDRFWAIRHVEFCETSDVEKSLKPPNFKCEICEEKFQHFKDLRIHLQFCKKDRMERLNKNENLEEILEIVNYLTNTSEVLRDNINNFGHQQFYQHYCVNCVKSIIDEVSVDSVECNNCKTMSLLQCNVCKCLHVSQKSIIEHLKDSFCGYQMQFFDDSNFPLYENKHSNNFLNVQHTKGPNKHKQKKNPSKNDKAAMPTIIIYCPQCTKSEIAQKCLRKCRNCKAKLMYRCDKCNKDVPTLKALNLHKKSHSFENYKLCPKCGRAFAQLRNLKLHEIICGVIKTTEDELIPKECENNNIVAA